MAWKDLVDGNLGLAQFGQKRFQSGVGFLGTVDKNGNPRVHPITPIIKNQRLFLFMYPDSPKAYDLKRNRKYAIHCSISSNAGGDGEFYIRGEADLVTDEQTWRLLKSANWKERQKELILFEFTINFAFSQVYSSEGGIKQRWRR